MTTASHAHQLARLEEIAAQLTDCLTVHGIEGMVGLHYLPSRGWSLILTTAWPVSYCASNRLSMIADEFSFTFSPILSTADRLTTKIDALPELEQLGSPITVPIDNPTA